jgi:galactokinase
LQEKSRTASNTIPEELKARFRARHGVDPRIFRAPGRVNLIGEHTDYNDGYVMPVAIDFHVWIACIPRKDRTVTIGSENFADNIEIDLDDPEPKPKRQWSDYIQGVAIMLEKAGHRLKGADLIVQGNVPIGAGLSSSAAVGVAAGMALLETAGIAPNRVELAQTCRRAENEFVGAHVGIMDPFISCCGRVDQALLLDCQSLQCQQYPVPRGVTLVICNTMVKHAHAGGEYNTRRRECSEGVRLLSSRLSHVSSLRDVELGQLESCAGILPRTIYKRCLHVVTENARVLDAAAALEKTDLQRFGECMAESHLSLRDNYEVSCEELDLMVELANRVEGVHGARMTGGGFGGCTINVVDDSAVAEFTQQVGKAYEKTTGHAPQIFVSPAAEGATEVTR